MVVLVLVSACAVGQQVPKGYGDTTSKNFQRGCVATAGSPQVAVDDPTAVCRCAYDRVRKEIPFDEFKEVFSDLQDEPAPLPANFVRIMTACVEGDSPSTTSVPG